MSRLVRQVGTECAESARPGRGIGGLRQDPGAQRRAIPVAERRGACRAGDAATSRSSGRAESRRRRRLRRGAAVNGGPAPSASEKLESNARHRESDRTEAAKPPHVTHVIARTSWLRWLLTLGAPLAAAGIGGASLIFWREAFAEGATLSGLNPTGGGPGFLVVLPAVAAGLLVGFVNGGRRTFWMGLVEGIALGCVVGLAAFLIASSNLPPEFPSIYPLVSSMGISFLVARVVVAALQFYEPLQPESSSALASAHEAANPGSG